MEPLLTSLEFHYLQGKKNPGTDPHSVKSFLNQVKEAKEMKIDRLGSLHGISFFS